MADTEDLVYQAVQDYVESVRGAVADIDLENLWDGVEDRVTAQARQELQRKWERAMRSGMQLAGEEALAQYRIPGSFTLDNPYSVPWLDEYGSQLVVEIDRETREAIKDVIREGFQSQRPVRQTAQALRGTVGLTTRDAMAVERLLARVQADAGVRAAQEAAREYADELLGNRLRNIARTESMAAANHGTWDSWATASDEGLLPDNVQRVWIASKGGERLCPFCGALHKKRTGLKSPWIVSTLLGTKTVWAPPAHPQCRCTQGLALPKNWNRRK